MTYLPAPVRVIALLMCECISRATTKCLVCYGYQSVVCRANFSSRDMLTICHKYGKRWLVIGVKWSAFMALFFKLSIL